MTGVNAGVPPKGEKESSGADTVSNVVHKGAERRPGKRERSALVNNLAAAPDAAGSRSFAPSLHGRSGAAPARARLRSPVALGASGPTSERTAPREGPRIRSRPSPARGNASAATKGPPMKSWNELTHFAGLDWAGDHHDVAVVDTQGRVVAEFRLEHSAAGWAEFRQKMAVCPAWGIALETRSGAAVEELLRSEGTVFPVQPKAAARYRERKAPSGVKDDQLDAWALADALRLDGQHWRALAPEDTLLRELRLLCRDEVALIEQRTALVNQLRAALREYYDAALQAFEDWTLRAAWALVVQFPTPEALAKAGKRAWEKSSTSTNCGGPRRWRNGWRSSPGPPTGNATRR